VSILGAGIVIGYILNPSLRWLYRKVYERYSAKPGTIVLKDGVYHSGRSWPTARRAFCCRSR
jgi:hypothetical protein